MVVIFDLYFRVGWFNNCTGCCAVQPHEEEQTLALVVVSLKV
jgi:hypothetical protein